LARPQEVAFAPFDKVRTGFDTLVAYGAAEGGFTRHKSGG
jgi:hypothetical protein